MMTSSDVCEVGSPPGTAQPRPPLRLRTNFLWSLLGNAVYQSCQIGLVVVLAKLTRGTGTQVVGLYDLAVATAAPVVALSSLQLRAAVATDRRGEFAFGHYLAVRLGGTVLAAVVIAGLAMAQGKPLVATLVIVGLGLVRCVDAVSDIVHGLFQQYERMDLSAVRQILRGLGSLLVLAILLMIAGRFVSAETALLCSAAGLLAFSAFMLVGSEYPAAARLLAASGSPARIRPRWEPDVLKRLVRVALPLGIGLMLVSLTLSIPRLLTERYLGLTALGVFGPMLYLVGVGQVVVASLGLAGGPRLALHFANQNRPAFDRLVLRIAGIALLIGGLGVMLAAWGGRTILTWLYQPAFGQYKPVFIVLMVGGLFSYVASALGFSVTATRRFSAQIRPLALTALACLLSGLVLIPRYGLIGAAYSVGVAAIVQMITLGMTLVLLRSRHVWHGQAKRGHAPAIKPAEVTAEAAFDGPHPRP